MSHPLGATIRHASVVLVSESPIESRSVTPETLRTGGIVPEDWVDANVVNHPLVAGLMAGLVAVNEYQNGISIRAEGNRCVFQQRTDGDFPDTYEVHDLAARYADAMRLAPYQAVGINWQVTVERSDPPGWIGEKMTNSEGIMADFRPVSLQISKQLEVATCNLTFRADNRRILLDCNYHFDLTNCSLQDAIGSWEGCQRHLREELLPYLR